MNFIVSNGPEQAKNLNDRDEDGQGENITGKSKKSIQIVDVTSTNSPPKIQVVNVLPDKLENAKDVNVTSKAPSALLYSNIKETLINSVLNL